MLQLKRWVFTILGILVIISGLGFIKFTQIKAAIAFGESFPEPSETVLAQDVTWSSFQPQVTVIGEVRATQRINIRNEVEGIITEMNLPSGGKVNKGDILIQLNVESEMAQLDAIKAEITLAELDVKRFTDLLDVRASSKEQLDRANAQLAVFKARARGIQADINKKTIVAPFDGFTGIHDWQEGTFLAANTLLTTLVGDNDHHWIDFKLAQIYADVNIGDLVTVSTEGSKAINAEIVAINKELENSSRSMQVRAKIENPPRDFQPGTVVAVLVPTASPVSAVPLPNQAIRYDAFGSFVYLLEKDEQGNLRANRQPVTVASKQDEISYVSDGLESGMLVATIGSAKLNTNMLTYVKAD